MVGLGLGSFKRSSSFVTEDSKYLVSETTSSKEIPRQKVFKANKAKCNFMQPLLVRQQLFSFSEKKLGMLNMPQWHMYIAKTWNRSLGCTTMNENTSPMTAAKKFLHESPQTEMQTQIHVWRHATQFACCCMWQNGILTLRDISLGKSWSQWLENRYTTGTFSPVSWREKYKLCPVFFLHVSRWNSWTSVSQKTRVFCSMLSAVPFTDRFYRQPYSILA